MKKGAMAFLAVLVLSACGGGSDIEPDASTRGAYSQAKAQDSPPWSMNATLAGLLSAKPPVKVEGTTISSTDSLRGINVSLAKEEDGYWLNVAAAQNIDSKNQEKNFRFNLDKLSTSGTGLFTGLPQQYTAEVGSILNWQCTSLCTYTVTYTIQFGSRTVPLQYSQFGYWKTELKAPDPNKPGKFLRSFADAREGSDTNLFYVGAETKRVMPDRLGNTDKRFSGKAYGVLDSTYTPQPTKTKPDPKPYWERIRLSGDAELTLNFAAQTLRLDAALKESSSMSPYIIVANGKGYSADDPDDEKFTSMTINGQPFELKDGSFVKYYGPSPNSITEAVGMLSATAAQLWDNRKDVSFGMVFGAVKK